MPESPEFFIFEKDPHIRPKRVVVLLDAFKTIFNDLGVTVPPGVELVGPNKYAVEQSNEEEVISVLIMHLERIKQIVYEGEQDGRSVVDTINEYLEHHLLLTPFLKRAEEIRVQNEKQGDNN
jgi:hypothetical protein